jgi:tripartite-type tricarboxylate transporter receptor subunit TctC
MHRNALIAFDSNKGAKMTHLAIRRACAALIVLAAATASAQTYPNKLIRIVVPYPPGGGADITARPIAQQANIKVDQ